MENVPTTDLRRSALSGAMVLILLGGLYLRVRSTLGDLSFEEISSIKTIVALFSPLGLLTEFRSFSNHILTSLYIYFVGEGASPFLYRAGSLVAGIGTLVIAYLLTGHRSATSRLTTLILFSFSFLLTLASSEARGFGGAVFFALFALFTIEEYQKAQPFRLCVLFWVLVALGMLSHVSFLYFYAASIVWSTSKALGNRQWWFSHVILHVVPLLFLAYISLAFYRHLPANASSHSLFLLPVLDTVSVSVGGPLFSIDPGRTIGIIAVTMILLVAVIIAEIFLLFREQNERWIIYLVTLFIAPAVYLLLLRPAQISVGAFLVPVAMFYLLAGNFFSRLLKQNYFGKLSVFLVFLPFLFGNGAYLRDLVHYGRGEYLATLMFIEAQESDPEIVLSGTHDESTKALVDYYAKYLQKPVQYLRRNEWHDRGPRWLILQSTDPSSTPERQITSETLEEYTLVRDAPFAGVSGQRWLLYRKSEKSESR